MFLETYHLKSIYIKKNVDDQEYHGIGHAKFIITGSIRVWAKPRI